MSTTPVTAPSEVAPPKAPAPAIEVDDLTKVYGDTVALDHVSFTVGRGEVLGFLGPNGAGKTTTMRILACYTPATSGRASIDGCDVARDSFGARRRLGYLPENTPLDHSMTVRGYLGFIAEIKKVPRAGARRNVEHAIEECGLGEVAGRWIGHLSKGYRQRVGIAQTIIGDPPVLILDEPTVGLDPRQIAEIRQMIREMAGHRTVLLSTHILSEVTMTCQKAIVIDGGRIAASGTPEKLVATIEGENPIVVTIEAEPGEARELLEKVPGVERVQLEKRLGPRRATFRVHPAAGADPRAAIARATVDGGFALIELSQPGLSLEDVFLRVISSSESG